MSDAEIKALSEADADTVKYIQDNRGYFIAYDNLFSTWVDPKHEFDEANVRDALSAFSRLISPTYKKLFEGIFTIAGGAEWIIVGCPAANPLGSLKAVQNRS